MLQNWVHKKAATISVLKVKLIVLFLSIIKTTNIPLCLDGSAGGHGHGHGHGHHDDGSQGHYQAAYVQASADPSELTVSRGESKTISCDVKGAQSFTVKWGKYAHDTTLPSYIRVSLFEKWSLLLLSNRLEIFSNKEIASSLHQLTILPRNKCTCNVKSIHPVKRKQLMLMHRSLFEVEMSRVRRKRNDVRR